MRTSFLLGAIALPGVLAGAGCKGKHAQEQAPTSTATTAAASPEAAASVPGPSTPSAPPADGAVQPRAGAAIAVSVPSTGPAPAGSFFLTVDLPLGGALVPWPPVTEGLPDPPPPGELRRINDLYYDQSVILARHMSKDVPPALAALRGARVALYSMSGLACEATITDFLVIKAGSFWGDLYSKARNPASVPDLADVLWTQTEQADIRKPYAALVIGDTSGSCEGAMFAVPAGTRPATVRVKAADDWHEAAGSAFGGTDLAMEADTKGQLEGSSGLQIISTRRVQDGMGPSLALVYAKLNDERTIAVFSVPPGNTFDDQAKFLSAVIKVEAPSEVVGVYADDDSTLDVVMRHRDGAALVLDNGEGVNIVYGVLSDPHQ